VCTVASDSVIHGPVCQGPQVSRPQLQPSRSTAHRSPVIATPVCWTVDTRKATVQCRPPHDYCSPTLLHNLSIAIPTAEVWASLTHTVRPHVPFSDSSSRAATLPYALDCLSLDFGWQPAYSPRRIHQRHNNNNTSPTRPWLPHTMSARGPGSPTLPRAGLLRRSSKRLLMVTRSSWSSSWPMERCVALDKQDDISVGC